MTTNRSIALNQDAELLGLLSQAEDEDLGLLVEYLTPRRERRGTRSRVQRTLIKARGHGCYPHAVRVLMLTELMQVADNRILRLLRKEGEPSYLDVVRDVARHFKLVPEEGEKPEALEARILEKLVEQAWGRMNEAERSAVGSAWGVGGGGAQPQALSSALRVLQMGGFAAYRIALFTAHALAQSLTGRGLSEAGQATIHHALASLSGPVVWALTAVWTVFDLASPSYRITVPCVIQIAYMRQKQSVNICPACRAPNDKGARFCNQCGGPVSRPQVP